jgi:hypothetical protein
MMPFTLIEHIPTIYAYWMGFCISWSSILLVDLNRLFNLIHKFHSDIRKSDKHLLFMLGTGMFTTTMGVLFSIFVSSLLIDIFFSIAFWYTVYLFFATIKIYTSLVKVDPTHVVETHKNYYFLSFR